MPATKPLPKKKQPSPTQRASSPKAISVAEAKAHFSSVITSVQKKRSAVVILKRGIPVAEIIPVNGNQPSSGFGWMRGSVQELGDIVGPTGVEWNPGDE